MPDAQFFLQARYALIDRRVSTPTGVLRQRAGQPRFAGAGGAGHQHAVAGAAPVAQRQIPDRAQVDAAPGARVDVFDGGLPIFEVRVLEQSCQLAVISGVDFAVDQQRQALFEAQRAQSRLGQLFFQTGGQAVEFQSAQLRQGGVHHHRHTSYYLYCLYRYW